jgi:hypothetical protein
LPLIFIVDLPAGYDDIYWPCAGSNLLLVNNGDGSFTEDATNAGVGVGGTNQGALWGDFNRDGFMDIFGGKDNGADYLYLNDGDSTFTLSTSAAGLATSGGALANTAGDVS